jgi:hypothetical protein
MTLRELNIGDYFYAKSDTRKKVKFHVLGKSEFNLQFGSATRKCMNLSKQEIQDKSCRLEVIEVKTPGKI